MPPKIQLDENLVFLYHCLEKSDYNSIDFQAVGAASNIKAPAARMRFTRLKKNIEAGTLAGGTGVHAPTPAVAQSNIVGARRPKRKNKDEDSSSNISLTSETPKKQVKTEVESNKELPTRRQTRGKNIDITAVFDNDSSIAPRARHYEDESSDYYDAESHVTEDDKEVDDAVKEDDSPITKHRERTMLKSALLEDIRD